VRAHLPAGPRAAAMQPSLWAAVALGSRATGAVVLRPAPAGEGAAALMPSRCREGAVGCRACPWMAYALPPCPAAGETARVSPSVVVAGDVCVAASRALCVAWDPAVVTQLCMRCTCPSRSCRRSSRKPTRSPTKWYGHDGVLCSGFSACGLCRQKRGRERGGGACATTVALWARGSQPLGSSHCEEPDSLPASMRCARVCVLFTCFAVAWRCNPRVQRGTTLAPGELKREITQLTEEKNQLTEKVLYRSVLFCVCGGGGGDRLQRWVCESLWRSEPHRASSTSVAVVTLRRFVCVPLASVCLGGHACLPVAYATPHTHTSPSPQIKSLQRKTAGAEGFKALLDATSALRREQEVETKLQERMYEQRSALVAAERRLTDTQRRLGELRATERVRVRF
jgi:hypothetical protein